MMIMVANVGKTGRENDIDRIHYDVPLTLIVAYILLSIWILIKLVSKT